MKYAILFRKLMIDGIPYYQGYSKAIGELVSDDNIKIVEGPCVGKIISPFETMNDYIYMEINKEEYDVIGNEKIYLKVVNNTFQDVSDFSEVANVASVFYKTFNDFNLLPEYDLDELVKNTKDELKDNLIGQDEPINKLLTKIYNNQLYYGSNLKNNVLLLGPFGTGKSTVKEILMNNFAPIPVVELQLTGDYNKDFFEMIRKLVAGANGNKFLAERGIVIIDGLNDLTTSEYSEEDEKIIYYMDTLNDIMSSKIVYLIGENASFDCSNLTFICMIDMNYDYTEIDDVNTKDYLYYSKVDASKLYALGLTPEMINNLFNDEIVYMNEMTKELALKILKNKKISPVYKLKDMLEKHNRKLEIKDGFFEELVEYGLEENEGFSGILKLFKYLVESKGYEEKNIILDPDELHDLQVGSYLDDESDEEEKINDNNIKNNDEFKVDLNKRTINGLNIKDTVDIIKKTVKGQDKGIFAVVNSFYNHVFNRYRGYTKEEIRELKENVLIFGSTGVGKTAIVRALANIFDLPFVREIATRYSKAGFVGEDVDSMLYDLVDAANGNVKKAENGILYIDEIDKIRASGDGSDSMSQGVQYNLLTLIEGDVRKMNATLARRGLEFDTSNLWVIGTGAFDGIDDFVKKRLKKENGLNKIGFGESKTLSKQLPAPTDDDLYNYGIDRQFGGRFPHKIRLNDMNENILYDIINNSDGGYVSLVKKGYAGDGILLNMSSEFKKKLASKALKKNQGARGIHSAFVDIKNTIDENIINGDIGEVILNEDCIDNLDNIQYIKKKTN